MFAENRYFQCDGVGEIEVLNENGRLTVGGWLIGIGARVAFIHQLVQLLLDKYSEKGERISTSARIARSNNEKLLLGKYSPISMYSNKKSHFIVCGYKKNNKKKK